MKIKTKKDTPSVVLTSTAPVTAAGFTLGLELGDRAHHVCVLAATRQMVREASLHNPRPAPAQLLAEFPRAAQPESVPGAFDYFPSKTSTSEPGTLALTAVGAAGIIPFPPPARLNRHGCILTLFLPSSGEQVAQAGTPALQEQCQDAPNRHRPGGLLVAGSK